MNKCFYRVVHLAGGASRVGLEGIGVWKEVCCGDRRNVYRWDSHDGLTLTYN